MLAPRRQLAARQELLKRYAAARHAALDRPDSATANFRRFLIGKAARTDEDDAINGMHGPEAHGAPEADPFFGRVPSRVA